MTQLVPYAYFVIAFYVMSLLMWNITIDSYKEKRYGEAGLGLFITFNVHILIVLLILNSLGIKV